MIYKGRRASTYLVAALALSGCLAVAACQSNRPSSRSSAPAAVAAQPVTSSCALAPDATAAWLRSQGFTAQAAMNFARSGELDCASVPGGLACAADVESASALRAGGFSPQAIKNFTRRDQRDC